MRVGHAKSRTLSGAKALPLQFQVRWEKLCVTQATYFYQARVHGTFSSISQYKNCSMFYHVGLYGLTNRLAAGQARVSSDWKSDGGILSFGEGKKVRWREGGREANRATALSLPRRFYARSSRKAATAADTTT